MISKILKMFGKTAKTVRDSVDDGLDFIDDTLEAEYITGSIQKAKDLSGKAVQKAGETYEKGRILRDELIGEDRIHQIKEKATQLIDSSKASVHKALEQPEVKKMTAAIKEKGQDVLDYAEKLTDGAEDYISGKLGLDEEE